MNRKNSTPFIATHPGELIKDEIKARGMTQKRLSELSGITPSVLSETVKGRRSISLNMAIGLQKALDIPAEIWLNLQNQYDLDSVDAKERGQGSRFTFVRLLIETILRENRTVSHKDREELNKITSLLEGVVNSG